MTLAHQLQARTIIAALRERARSEPDRTACVFVWPDRDDDVYTTSDLMDLAGRFASLLGDCAHRGASGTRPIACICLYHSVELHAAFIGAMMAGYLPSMLAPPSPRMEKRKYTESFVGMLEHIRPAVVITDDVVLDALTEHHPDALSGHHILNVGLLEEQATGRLLFDDVDEQDVALLQHSSGTTGLQKGVALSHRAVMAQLRGYAKSIGLSRDDVIVSWLPLYHDMGFIACFIMPLVTGVPVVELSPFDWVARPRMLLEKIEQHGGSLCWLPNFAFTFMANARQPEGATKPDLGCVRAFINCSEPVMASSHRQFAKRYDTVTFEQLTTCYAMAENVFAVTQSPPGRPAVVDIIRRDVFEREHRAEVVPMKGDDTLELMSSGRVIDGVEVRIVDEDDTDVPERCVGDILIRGTSMFDGYFRRDDLTRAALRDGWYSTGDLGYLAIGELFVTGRRKDLLIVQGRNFYPADIEAAVSAVDGVLPGRVAVIGETDGTKGTETLVVLAETELTERKPRAMLELGIRRRVAQTFDCTVGRVCLVPRKWLIKSTSGKVARTDNKRKYEAEFASPPALES